MFYNVCTQSTITEHVRGVFLGVHSIPWHFEHKRFIFVHFALGNFLYINSLSIIVSFFEKKTFHRD